MKADIIAEDREGRPVLVVEVKPHRASPEELERFMGQVAATRPAVPFGMLVDVEEIVVFQIPLEAPRDSFEFETAEILRPYDDEIGAALAKPGSRQILHDSLTTLISVWLQDLALTWKFETPPGKAELDRLGLAEKLAGGTILEEAFIGGDALH